MNRINYAVIAVVTSLAPLSLTAQTVTKLAEPFDAAGWVPSQWNRATGTVINSPEAAPGTPSKGSMELQINFSGGGFEHFTASPAKPVYLPGNTKSITMRIKRSAPKCGLTMKFIDGWGRSNINDKEFTREFPVKAVDEWETSTVTIPDDWVRPVAILGLGTHNWETQRTKNTAKFWVDELEATTDITEVDAKTGILKTWTPNPEKADSACPITPLLDVTITSDDTYNIFSRKEPGATVMVKNWQPGSVAGKVTWKVAEFEGKQVAEGAKDILVDAAQSVALSLDVKRFGVYVTNVDVVMATGQTIHETMKFAKLPPYRDLTQEQKLKSPYGLNVHSGHGAVVDPFRRAGVIWFRDYAFQIDWLTRARGPNRTYEGWPWYPKILAAYEEAGAILLPCLMGSIKPPAIENGKAIGRIGPDEEWVRSVTDVILKYPHITHWELDNEYDLNAANRAAEDACDWKNYGAYNKTFGDLVNTVGQGRIKAVQNGCAGIHPDWVERHIKRGDFEHISVVNSHHYCGVDAPEVNIGNFNTGFEESFANKPGLYFDQLRTYQRAGNFDGRGRESWLTEFGWDVLRGMVVTRQEQALYLPRGWMVGMAAGVDKMFWFTNFDDPQPKSFFSGMGLLDGKRQPNLSMASLAALAYVMPTPKYVGEINAGPGTQGYIFEQDGKLIASLWSISDDKGPSVSFKAEQIFDWLGNPIEGKKVQLTRGPIYVVGLDKSDPFFAQSSYSIDTNHLVVTTAGATIEPVVLVDNRRSAAINSQIRVNLPTGWSTTSPQQSAEVPAGAEKRLTFPLVVDPSEILGMKEVTFEVIESGKTIKQMKLLVIVQPQMVMEVGALRGLPGATDITVKLKNKSEKAISPVLTMELPRTWTTTQASTTVPEMAAGEVREVKVPLTWSAAWATGETASVVLTGPQNLRISQPIIPNQFEMHRVSNITIDGKLDDWSDAQRIPTWMLGSSLGEPRADVYLAWSAEGLQVALRVKDSQVQATDPRSFWMGDVCELWIDTRGKKDSRKFEPGDHHFWFVPQVDPNRVYVGQWKHGAEIEEVRFDIPDCKTAARRIDGGYEMEFLLPTSALKDYRPAEGSSIGLNMNLTVKGKQFDREVFWPLRKNDSLTGQPDQWGAVKLVK